MRATGSGSTWTNETDGFEWVAAGDAEGAEAQRTRRKFVERFGVRVADVAGMKVFNDRWLIADWPAPAGVHAATSLRTGGVSPAPWDSLNLAMHVEDDPARVVENRRRLGLPAEPVWLEQVHGKTVVRADTVPNGEVPRADAAWTDRAGVICAVLTADCLPVLFCDRAGTRVAAAHAGWRGLAAGVLEATLATLGVPGDEILAWLGPAIGRESYEVDETVRTAFLAADPAAETAFTPTRPGHWHLDLCAAARSRLEAHGVTVHGGDRCTCREADRFYSYRRDGLTGRMASVIWFG